MKIKLCRLCLSAIAAVFVSVFAFADGGPNASKAVDGKSLTLEEFQGSDTLMNRSATVNGPWKYERLPLDLNGRKLIEGESNFSFTRRPDGSVLAVCRGGAIWLSEDGIKPFVMMTGRVYPDVAGRFEDPVLWRDEVQYHLVVNDWLGRVAWYLTSPDGFNWTTQPGEAYMPGIASVAGGVTNEWFKYERMRVTTDVFGRVFQANFAVIDCVKREDRGADIHSSKNITIPVNPGRRVQTFRKTRRGWEMRIMKERGFNPLTDVDVESVTFGPQSMVAFGAGVKPVGTDEANGDLVLIFPLIELDTPVVKALGREKSGRLFFATCRVDGTKLAGDCRFGTGAVAKGPSVPRVRNSDPTARLTASFSPTVSIQIWIQKLLNRSLT